MVFRLYNKVNPIETSYRNIKSFLPFISSTRLAFRKLMFMIALYFLLTIFKDVKREDFYSSFYS
ncbi:Third ORF in transposon ISC1160 [Saccharolobus solfataricus P2]|uniref:Second ORF in transposon ISC1160 n=2 Tax=Saccharolobus solfataricus TaxID=2287 RepID=Q97TW6_SACS2|nr:Second ORF in transposon ISC1160 [Saccharolobus solfataricus P2]AAK67518.1 Third ORF in transposon ISC1160 [Saccharolobus solfataricus P2]SAI85013.1 ORF3 in transposon ISC1160 [Saccharolobus solfataricus]